MQSSQASPFPGMDPYLEDDALWPEFQHQLVTHLMQIVQPDLRDVYRATIGQRRYSTSPSEGGKEHRESFVEIRRRMDGTLVTLLEIVSPANKTTATGRQAYLAQRRIAQQSGANVVEIDLVLQGQPTLDYSRDGLPEWHYAITVTRETKPDRYEIYTGTLQKRLPRFRLPLAPDDRDSVIDLQTAFVQCYARGGYFERIDYRREPAHDQIAHLAYCLWRQKGCPHGRDKDHWLRALARFRMHG